MGKIQIPSFYFNFGQKEISNNYNNKETLFLTIFIKVNYKL